MDMTQIWPGITQLCGYSQLQGQWQRPFQTCHRAHMWQANLSCRAGILSMSPQQNVSILCKDCFFNLQNLPLHIMRLNLFTEDLLLIYRSKASWCHGSKMSSTSLKENCENSVCASIMLLKYMCPGLAQIWPETLGEPSVQDKVDLVKLLGGTA